MLLKLLQSYPLLHEYIHELVLQKWNLLIDFKVTKFKSKKRKLKKTQRFLE